MIPNIAHSDTFIFFFSVQYPIPGDFYVKYNIDLSLDISLLCNVFVEMCLI